MAWTARDLMQTKVLTADPQMRVTDLERRLVEKRVSGFPVVSKGRLLGIVSLSDIVRRLCVEQSIGEVVADYYRDFGSGTSSATTAIGSHVGGRIENLRVQDVMTSAVITVSGDTPVRGRANSRQIQDSSCPSRERGANNGDHLEPRPGSLLGLR